MQLTRYPLFLAFVQRAKNRLKVTCSVTLKQRFDGILVYKYHLSVA